MDYLTLALFDNASIDALTQKLLAEKDSWEDGKKTAGLQAAKVKNNLQLDRSSKSSIESADFVATNICSNQLIKSFALPRKVHGIMFTKTSTGQGYGLHVDNAYMSTGRSDLSFTVFLSDPQQYKGGELCLQTLQGSKLIKLEKGHIVVYPSTSLHSVESVTEGERLACVGWIQSYVPRNEDRENLFRLDAGARGLLSQHGRSSELDLVFQAYSNLLRRLGD